MLTTRKQGLMLYVDRATGQWIALDEDGILWVVPAVQNAWEQRTLFESTEETDLQPVPGHYKYMLGLPF